MDTYIVRIYRPPKGASGPVLGVVERVGADGFQKFSNFDELREIIVRRQERKPSARTDERSLGVGE